MRLLHHLPVIGCLLLFFCATPASAAMRVAVVTTGSVESANQAIALATVELSGDKNLELLDRESVNAILQEQKLSLSGLVDAERMIQVGKLLGANLFAVMDMDQKGGQAAGLVVFDAATGLRLWDAAIPGNPEQAARSIVSAIRAAAIKDRSLNRDVRLVAFLPVRNADLPRDRDLLADALRLLLERQLTSSPGIAVLERGRLEHVNQERQLPSGQGQGDLWPSVVIVQLEISRVANGRGIKATAILTSGSGQRLDALEATIDGNSAADLAEKLQDRLIASLKVKAAGRPFDRGEEARRFARDSDLLTHSARFAAGAAAAEAANALQPNDDHQLILSNALWARAWEYLTPHEVNLKEMRIGGFERLPVTPDNFDRALASAARALEMQRVALKTILSYQHPNRGFLEYTGGEIRITLLHGTCRRLNAVKDIAPASQPLLAEFRAAAMVYILEYFDGWAREIKTNPGDLFSFNAEILYTLSASTSFATDLASFTVMRDHLFHTWIAAFDPSWQHTGTLWMQAGLRQSQLMMELLGAQGGVRGLDHYSDEVFNKNLKPIADDLNHSSHPVMRMYGFIASALADPERSKKTPVQQDQTRQALMRLFETTLAANGPAAQQTRQYAYIAAVDGMHLLPEGTRSASETAIDFLNLALRRKQVIPYITLKLIFEEASPSSSGAPPRDWLHVLEKTLELSRTTDGNGLDGNADGVRQMLTEEIRDLRERHPELGPAKVARPWESVRRLADIDSLPRITRFEEFPQVQGDRVCFLGSGKDADGKFFLQAFEVALAGGPPRALGIMRVEPLRPVGNGYWPIDGFVYRLIQGGAVDDRNYYVSVRGEGVVVFPRDGAPASRLNKDTGLPSDWARSLVAKDGYLYVVSSADDGAYLTKWNPKDKTSEVCISSLRKETKSPLDDVSSVRIRFMVDDVSRKRLILGVRQNAERAGMRWDEVRGGLWSFDTTNSEMRHLLTADDLGHARGIDHDALFLSTTLWVVQFDLETISARYASFKPNMVPEEYIREMSIGEKTIKGAGWAEPDTERAGTRKVIDRWLWLGEPFSRISADTRTVELLDAQLMPDVKPIGPVWTMEPVGANRLVLGDIRQLYVATLHNPSDETPGTRINLMPLIDVDKDQVSGGWHMDGERLTTDGQYAGRMNIPYEPPEEYDFQIDFTRIGGDADVCQILSHDGKRFVWTMGAYGTCHFFANVGGSYVENNPTRVKSTALAANGQKHRCVVKVRKGSLSSYLDGSLVAYHETDYSDFSMSGGWHLEEGALGVASWWSATQFDRIELVEVTGHGKPIAHLNPGAVRMPDLFDADFIAPARVRSRPTTMPATAAYPFIPTSAEQAKARTKFKDKYAIQLADHSRSARSAFADQLIEAAGKTTVGSTDRFVLLMAARQCAIEAVDLTPATTAIDALGNAYDLDSLKLMLDTALHIGGRAHSAAAGADNCRAGIKLLDQLLAAGDVEGALAASAVLKSAAVFDPMYNSIVQYRVKEIEALQAMPKDKSAERGVSPTLPRIVDVLSMADAQAGAVHGNWMRTDGGLTSDASKARFEFPYRPPAEYLVRVEFTRLSGNDGIDICVAKGTGAACWTAGGWGNTLCTFQAVDGFPSNDNAIRAPNWIQNGQRMVSCFEVRNGIIRGYVNGELLLERKTNLQDMHDPHVETRARDISRLAITSWDSPMVLHRVEVLELSGHGESLR